MKSGTEAHIVLVNDSINAMIMDRVVRTLSAAHVRADNVLYEFLSHRQQTPESCVSSRYLLLLVWLTLQGGLITMASLLLYRKYFNIKHGINYIVKQAVNMATNKVLRGISGFPRIKYSCWLKKSRLKNREVNKNVPLLFSLE